ncbi:MAG: RNA polymerase sigma-70 factor [Dysgonamonadaceae bacterium]|jgi:RNA polymerase sigma-70 factor (ECF subfamily)|nr:RNA polymerase sigma-70 factor [Dysgonamonadaceae bacterium]
MSEISELVAFNKLFESRYKQFIRFANSYVRDTTVAEDFTAEAFMRYWENRHTLLPGTNPSAYVLTVLRNKCLNYLQHLQVHQEMIEKLKGLAQRELDARIAMLWACDPTELYSVEIQEIVKKTLCKLPEKTRMIFQMSRDENLSHTEISRLVGLGNKSIEFHISKAMKALRIALKEYLSFFLGAFIFRLLFMYNKIF